MSPTFDYDATDISRAYAAARTLTEERARVWRAHLRDELETHDVREIIDLGCGVGRFSPLLREVFHARVYAIDPSELMLATAIANPEAHLVTWLRASAEALAYRRSKDRLGVSVPCLPPPSRPARGVTRMFTCPLVFGASPCDQRNSGDP